MDADYISSFEFIWDIFNSLFDLFRSANIWVNLRLDEAIEAVLSIFPFVSNINIPTINITVLDICTGEILIMLLITGVCVFILRAIKEFIP